MDESLVTLLQNISFFRLLAPEEIRAFASNIHRVPLKAGEILFEQGSPSQAIYILIRGELIGYLVDDDKHEKFVNVMEPQEIIGELGVLSGEPRSITVKAASTNDAELLEITPDSFKALCQTHPTIIFEIVSSLIKRSQANINLMGKSTIEWTYIIADQALPYIPDLKEKLQKQLMQYEQAIFLDQEKYPLEQLHKFIYDLYYDYKNVIFWIDTSQSKVFDKLYSITQGKVYFIVEANNPSYTLDPLTQVIYEKMIHHTANKPYLIILHPATAERPKGTKNWLTRYKIKQHYHVRYQQDEDYARLARFLVGKAIGIVMGGGGTKVIAHAGLLKAVDEKKVVVDTAGGTSGGALVAAGYLLHHPLDAFIKNVFIGQRAAYRAFSYKDFTWPIISLFSGKSITQALHVIYDDVDIEDLWLPFFCITSNLSNYTEEVHYTGKLWEKLRGTIAIPGVLSPMLLNNELHFDGGLINNLPVDVMKSICGLNGTVIASYLHPTNRRNQDLYSFPPVLNMKEVIFSKLHLSSNNYKFPPFFDVLIKALLLGAHNRELANSAAAEILVNPNLSKYGFMSTFTEEVENEIVRAGYEEGLNQIEKHKKLLLFNDK